MSDQELSVFMGVKLGRGQRHILVDLGVQGSVFISKYLPKFTLCLVVICKSYENNFAYKSKGKFQVSKTLLVCLGNSCCQSNRHYLFVLSL